MAAEAEDTARLLRVFDAQEQWGVLEDPPEQDIAQHVRVLLDSDERITVPARLLHREAAGRYRFDEVFADYAGRAGEPVGSEGGTPDEHTARVGATSQVIPVAEEELRVHKRQRETATVRVAKRVREHETVVREPVRREEVDVRRVPVGRVLKGPVDVRREGSTTIIPIIEERLVVRVERVLVEEVHVTTHTVEAEQTVPITLRYEDVEVERISAEGAGPITEEASKASPSKRPGAASG